MSNVTRLDPEHRYLLSDGSSRHPEEGENEPLGPKPRWRLLSHGGFA